MAQVELARSIEQGDGEARRRLIEANLRLVVSIAKTYRGRGVPLVDLVQDGCLGLIRAADRYDWRRGHRFTTYTTLWIRQAMGRGIANGGSVIRSPSHVVDLQPTVARVEQVLAARLARDPTAEDVGRETGLDPNLVRLVRTSREPMISLAAPAGADDDHEIGEFLVDRGCEAPERAGEVAVMRTAVQRALQGLTERERAVVELRFGLVDDHPRSFAEVGRRLGITREAVRQIEGRVFAKLERLSGVRGLRDTG